MNKQITIDASIFKAYDIRGIVDKNLHEETAEHIGKAIAYKVLESGQNTINIGYDGRLSSPKLAQGLIKGITQMGVNVINLGLVATPMTYFANFYRSDNLPSANSSIMVTGSHNPPNYNGFKIVINSKTLYGDDIQELYKLAVTNLELNQNIGNLYELDILPAYLNRIVSDIKLARPLKIALDAGNGVAGISAPQILKALGCEIIELFCDVDGNFPNHHPDPAQPHNLEDLIQAVKQHNCDYGIAFDGDGDRLGIVTKNGEIIYPDRQMVLYAQSALMHKPNGKIIFDVKCSANLAPEINKAGGQAIMYKTGHSLIKAYMKQEGAILGGEMSGHIFFNDRWYGFDDATYTAARLAEILSTQENPSQTLENLPNSYSTPELQVDCGKFENTNQFEIMEHFKSYIQSNIELQSEKISYMDGVRIDFEDGFGLARPSNTTPVIVMRFEGKTKESLSKIQNLFKQHLTQVAPFLEI
ncbi:MAG: hypothetical protein RLZZ210_1457 [Pseudomonadota bacterium]|jgi:phosphomannomutase